MKLGLVIILAATFATTAHAKEILAFSCKLDNGGNIAVHYDNTSKGYVYRASGKKALTLRSKIPSAQGGGMARQNLAYVFPMNNKARNVLIVHDSYDRTGDDGILDSSSVRVFGGMKPIIHKCVTRNDPGETDYDALMESPESREFERDYPQYRKYVRALWD